ncbi:MAG TPA: type II CAAX endopeptidase family protein [Syntrophorhabdaceae bacterium]|jgi:membrane protease YdiL (CAAX protease family)
MNARAPKWAITWFIVAGILGLIAFAFFYNEAFPEASLDMKLSRGEITAKSGEFLKARGFDLSGYRSVAVFTEQRNQIDFLERLLGLKKANDLFRKTVAVWRWSVRWFRELEEVEYSVEYTPDGRLAGFSRKIPKSAPGARLDEHDARGIAEAFLAKELAFDLTRYEYIERTMEDCPRRLDQTLVWRSLDWRGTGGSEYRVGVTVQGDRIGAYSEWLKIPQTWTLAQEDLTARRELLANLAYLPILLLYLGMAVVFFWRAHAADVKWRRSFVIAGFCGAVVFLEQINKLPFSFLFYDTTQSLNVFWLKYLAMPILASIAGFLLFIPLFAATDSIGRLYLPERSWVSNVFSRTFLASGDAGKQVLLGYAMAFAAIGYVTLFYVAGQRFIGVWSPVQVKFSNSFATYFPSLTAIYTGFSAAFTEELTFRLFAIAILYRLFGRVWPAVVIPAFIWGFAHTTYPQEPVWIRGAELTLAGLVYGWVFLRYGLVTTLVSHFIYNVFVGIVPQLQSGQPGLVLNGLLALTLPLLALFFARKVFSLAPWRQLMSLLFRHKKRMGPATAAPEVIGESIGICVEKVPWKRFAAFLLAAALIFGLSFLAPSWNFYGKAPPVKFTREQGAALGEKALKASGIDPAGFRSYTIFRDRTEGLPRYVISQYGVAGTWERFRGYYGYDPLWTTRWYKEKTVRTMVVSIDERGRLLAIKERLPETDPGARLSEETAKGVAGAFLSRARPSPLESWECMEADKVDRPNRLDYELTYRDRRFAVGDLQRKLSMVVSGDRVTALSVPQYEVPEEWERKREVLQKGLRNSVRQILAIFLGVGLLIFFVVQVVLLFRRRLARRNDVRQAVFWGVALGAIPALLEALNGYPRFFHAYFYETAQSLAVYTLTGVLGIIVQVIWMPVGVFFLVLLSRMVLRAWIPEYGEFATLLEPLRPSRFRSIENRQGLFLGFAAAAIGAGFDRLGSAAKAWLAPDLFTPQAATTNITINQFSELLNLADKAPSLIVASLLFLVMAAFVRRFLRRETLILGLAVFAAFLYADNTGISWRNLLVAWLLDTVAVFVLYFTITRVIRWNVTAFLVWMWIEVNSEAITNFRRFAFSHSPEFSRPSLEQMAVLVLPLAVLFILSFIGRGKGREVKEPSDGYIPDEIV